MKLQDIEKILKMVLMGCSIAIVLSFTAAFIFVGTIYLLDLIKDIAQVKQYVDDNIKLIIGSIIAVSIDRLIIRSNT